jgi:hypothetical protein
LLSYWWKISSIGLQFALYSTQLLFHDLQVIFSHGRTQINCPITHLSFFQPWKDSDNLPNHPPLLSWRRNSLEPHKEEHHFNLFTSKFLRLSKLHSLDISSIAPFFISKILSFLFFDSYSFGLAATDPKKRCGLSGERKSL